MRKAHILKENKSRQVPRLRVYFDSESNVSDLTHKPYLNIACFKDDRYKKENWVEYIDQQVSDFWNTVAGYGGRKSAVYVFAHNASYDLIVTRGIPVLIRNGFKVVSFFEKGSTFLMTFRKTVKGKNKKGEEVDRTIKTIQLISSTNFFTSSLASLGEIFNLPKLDFDHENPDPKKAVPYCKRDVEICKVAVESFIEFVREQDLGVFAKTTPGQAFNAYRHRFMTVPIYLHDNDRAADLERESYYGGRVECWQIGEYESQEGFYGFDINSMYPHVMRSYIYPVRLLTVRKRTSLPELKRFISSGMMICGEVTLETDRPAYPVKIGKNLIFPVGRFKTHITTPEIKMALDRGELVECGTLALYDDGEIFRDYVDYFYTKRLQAKEEENKVYDHLFKLFLNSLYGKFGQRSETWSPVGEAPADRIGTEEIYNVQTKELQKFKIFGGTIFKQEAETEGFNSFCAIAAHVTAYARLELWKYIELAGLENVLYMDTDSLFTTAAGAARIMPYTSNTELGKMKLEKQDTRIMIRTPKHYSFAGVTKIKGVKKGSIALDPAGTIFKNTHWPRLNTFIRGGDLSGYYNVIRVKVLKGNYNKAWVTETGRVAPFQLDLTDGKNRLIPWADTSYAALDGLTLLDPNQAERFVKLYKNQYPQEKEGETKLQKIKISYCKNSCFLV